MIRAYSFVYEFLKYLASGEKSLIPRRVRNSLRFSRLYLRLGMKQAQAAIKAEFPEGDFPILQSLVDRNDGMYAHDHPQHYFYVAYSALACVHSCAQRKSGENFRSILDLPCGHGRVLRALKAAFPEASFTACDLDEQAVDFCSRTFGVSGVYSKIDPRMIHIRANFDLIWVGSLFTHLNCDRWSYFLDLFRSVLTKDGLLLFSTHGEFVAERLERFSAFYGLSSEQIKAIKDQYARRGFGYADYSNLTGYGISLSAPEWIKRTLKSHSLDLAAFMPKGWDNHHDVWAVKCKMADSDSQARDTSLG